MKLIERLLGFERRILTESQRAVVLYKGRFMGIYGPGEHRLPNRANRLVVELHDLARSAFVSAYDKALFRGRPELADEHLLEVRTGADEVALILRDGQFYGIQKPDARMVVWRDCGPWHVDHLDVSESLVVPKGTARHVLAAGKSAPVSTFEVAQGQCGLLFIEGAYVETLSPGTHLYWDVGRKVRASIIDLRRQALDVAGQEILTKDRVSIRINLMAEYTVTDPVKAATSVSDFTAALYRTLQLAFRKVLGAQTLDQILATKAAVDAEVLEKVRHDMAEIGLKVGEIAIKDVILPGEMREILNQVVAAEKQAEANVIRRREETNATRSLLNTAKVMAENPVMLRLKELEALEGIAGKVKSLTIHNGTQGLMNDLVSLTE
nr:slipin family protein [Breoghania corrubedonensis]